MKNVNLLYGRALKRRKGFIIVKFNQKKEISVTLSPQELGFTATAVGVYLDIVTADPGAFEDIDVEALTSFAEQLNQAEAR